MEWCKRHISVAQSLKSYFAQGNESIPSSNDGVPMKIDEQVPPTNIINTTTDTDHTEKPHTIEQNIIQVHTQSQLFHFNHGVTFKLF